MLLEQRRRQVAAHRVDLERAAEGMDETMELGERLAFDYGIAVAATELSWLDGVLVQLSQHPLSEEVG